MQRASIGSALIVSAGVLALIGCAVGTDPEVGVADLAATPVEAGQQEEASVKLPPAHHDGEEDTDASADEDAGVDGGGGTDSGGGGTDAGGGGVDAGGGTTCASPNTCLGATDLGTISGDTGADFKTATGSGSQWFKVRVTENDSDLFGLTLLAKAELSSPPGTNFDVFVYLAGGSSGQECSVVKSSSTSIATFDSTSIEWGEGTLSNGSDDSRMVTVEVRWVSGTCNPAAKWTLTVRGDTP